MPVVIYAIVFQTTEFLVKHELMKKETYEKLDGDEPIFFFYIGWFVLLWFLVNQGYSWMPFYN